MLKPIPRNSRTRLMRLISARADLDEATSSCRQYWKASDPDHAQCAIVSMVMAYNRPFTENKGIGSLECEYPGFPDFDDPELNTRHQRMVDLRNGFMGHSSVEGTKAFLLAPGSIHPATNEKMTTWSYAVAKRTFLKREYVKWLGELVDALSARVAADLASVCEELGTHYLEHGEIVEIDSRHEAFKWNAPKTNTP